jgi:hypothetical protein
MRVPSSGEGGEGGAGSWWWTVAKIKKDGPKKVSVGGSVPDLASRIRDVVLIRRIFSSGKPRGVGIWDGEGMGRGWKGGGKFTSNLGPRWTGSYHDKEGFQVSKRGMGLN